MNKTLKDALDELEGETGMAADRSERMRTALKEGWASHLAGIYLRAEIVRLRDERWGSWLIGFACGVLWSVAVL